MIRASLMIAALACISWSAPALAAPKAVHASVRGSIELTLVRQVGEPGRALGAQVARLLRWKGDVARQVHAGDRMDLVYEPGAMPELLALHYRGAQLSIEAYRMEDAGGIARYYDARGVLVEPVLRNSPIDSYDQITETVQRGRGKRKHDGLDLKAKTGTPLRLPFDALVNRVNWSTRRNGKCIEVIYKSGGKLKGKLARYLHLSRVEKSVKPGQRLSAGTLLGAVGNTGRSSGEHLHYEVRSRKTGRPLSPLKLHGTQQGRVAAKRMPAFEVQRRAFAELIDGQGAGGQMATPAE